MVDTKIKNFSKNQIGNHSGKIVGSKLNQTRYWSQQIRTLRIENVAMYSNLLCIAILGSVYSMGHFLPVKVRDIIR